MILKKRDSKKKKETERCVTNIIKKMVRSYAHSEIEKKFKKTI